MGSLQDAAASKPLISVPTRARVILSAVRYLARKALMIMVSVFVGVFITLMISNVPRTYRAGFVATRLKIG